MSSIAAVERHSPVFEGWRLTAALSAAIAASALGVVLAGSGDAAAITLAIRLTARSSLLIFCLAYSASALHHLLPHLATRWLLRNRRQLGLAFAASHAVHGVAIIAYAALHPQHFAQHVAVRPPLPGLIAYGLIVAMALTSSNRAQSFLGMRAWKILHGVGGLYIWVAFSAACWTRVAQQPLYLIPLALLVAVMLLRFLSWVSRRREGV